MQDINDFLNEGMLNTNYSVKLPKHKYLISCSPTKDFPNRFLVLTTTADLSEFRSRYPILDKWNKKYPDDNADDYEVYIDLDSIDFENYDSNSKLLSKLCNAIKKGKTSMVTIGSMIDFGYSHPDRYLEKFVKEAIRRGPNNKK